MAWIKMDSPWVPSLEDAPAEYAKRFTSVRLTDLLVDNLDWFKDRMDKLNIKDERGAIEFGIRAIAYPFWWGMPTDKHTWNAFHGKACFTVPEDYWQTPAETLMTYILNQKLKGRRGYGDCEDSSMLIVGMLRVLGIEAYEILGEVYRGSELLGGHGYLIARFPDGTWRLVESTLDVPPAWPNGYPVVDPDKNVWEYGNLRYVGAVKYNESEFYEWRGNPSYDMFNGTGGGTVKLKDIAVNFYEYSRKKHKHKHGKKKVKAIKKEWNKQNKGGD